VLKTSLLVIFAFECYTAWPLLKVLCRRSRYTDNKNKVYRNLNQSCLHEMVEPDKPPSRFRWTYYHLRNAVRSLDGAKEGQKLWRGQGRFYDAEEGQEEGHSYQKGALVVWKEFVSTATSREPAVKYAANGGARNSYRWTGVLFEIQGAHANLGASFQQLSIYPDEDEILLPPGTSFQVLERFNEGGLELVTLKYVGTWVSPLTWQGPKPAQPLRKPQDYLEIFVQTKCGLEIESRWPHDVEGHAGTYTITGERQVEILVRKFKMRQHEIQGRLSPKSAIPVPEDEREGAGIPTHAETFCYIHPLQTLANMLWPRAADELRKMRAESGDGFENTEDAKWIDAVMEGGFAYFDAAGETIRVNAISLQPTETEMVFRGFQVEAQHVVTEMDRLRRLADIAEESEFTAGFRKVGWIHSMETFGQRHQLVSDEHDYSDGAFLVLHAPETEGGSDVTWFYIMIDPNDATYADSKRVAQEHLSNQEETHGLFSDAYNEAVRAHTNHVSHVKYKDHLPISIAQDVDLKIEPHWDDAMHAGEYRVAGLPLQYPVVNKVLETQLELTLGQLRGSLSPKHVVTVPPEVRANAGIPPAAVRKPTRCGLLRFTQKMHSNGCSTCR
jgi:hypothetical protein